MSGEGASSLVGSPLPPATTTEDEFDYDEETFTKAACNATEVTRDITADDDNAPTVAVVVKADDGVDELVGTTDSPITILAEESTIKCKELQQNKIVTEESTTDAVPSGEQDSGLQIKQQTEQAEEAQLNNGEWEDLEIDPQQETNLATNSTERISFQEALQHFEAVDLKEFEEKIKPKVKRSGLSSVFHSIVGPAKLHKSLASERNLIFTLALIPFDNEDKAHIRILQTVYKTLSRRKIDCARFGPHWELIGFQGNDPSTDLRGCGMLGLLTVLSFASSLETQVLAANIYQLSLDEIQNFPFCVMSINLTRIALQILRQGKLNKECNRRMKHKSQKYRNEFDTVVFDVFQELYQAIFYKIYTVWKNEGKTMTESGFVLRDVETLAKQKPLELMKTFSKMQNSKKQSRSTSKKSNQQGTAEDGKIESFVGIEDLADHES